MRKAIELTNVKFSYNEDQLIFEDLNIEEDTSERWLMTDTQWKQKSKNKQKKINSSIYIHQIKFFAYQLSYCTFSRTSWSIYCY